MSVAKKPLNRSGILAGGNWIIDQVKMIDVYPQREQLANIIGPTVTGTGGSPYNLLVNFAKLGLSIPLSCLLYTSPSPRDATLSRMPSSA